VAEELLELQIQVEEEVVDNQHLLLRQEVQE
jgi:hypothetical protein